MMDDDDLVRIGRCPMPRDWLAYYRALRALHAVDFVVLWKEEGYDEFAEMRGSVPPLVARDNAFMVGEPVTAMELSPDGSGYRCARPGRQSFFLSSGARAVLRPGCVSRGDPCDVPWGVISKCCRMRVVDPYNNISPNLCAQPVAL